MSRGVQRQAQPCWTAAGSPGFQESTPTAAAQSSGVPDGIPKRGPACKRACAQLPELLLPTIWCRPSLGPKGD